MTTQRQLVFGARALSETVHGFALEERRNTFCQGLFRSGRQHGTRDNDLAEWDRVDFARGNAPVTTREGKFRSRKLMDRENNTSAMAHVKLSKVIPAGRLFHERGNGPSLRPNAQEVVDNELRELTKEIRNSIELMCAEVLTTGALTVNVAKFPGSEVAWTLNFASVAHPLTLLTAAADWALPATGIVSAELPRLHDLYSQASGLEAVRAIMTREVKTALLGNAEVQTFITQLLGDRFASDGTINAQSISDRAFEGFRLGGLDWHVNTAGYKNPGGAFTKFFARPVAPPTDLDLAVLLPDDLGEAIGMAEGWGFLPGTAFVGGPQGQGSMPRIAPTRGFYGYSTPVGGAGSEEPPGVRVYAGWVGLPIMHFPEGVAPINTTP